MTASDIQIGLIHSSQELIKEVQNIATKKNYHVLVEPYCIEAAISAGKRMEDDGIPVIVSRRHTASILREHVSIPTLGVPVTFFDIYQSIWRAAKKWKTILVPILRGNIKSEKILELKSMIDSEILFSEYDTSKQMEDVILWGKQQGCQGVVGGPVTKVLAVKTGLECEEITSSSEAIEHTLDEAYWIAVNRKKEKEHNHLYKIIADMGSKCVIAVDQNGYIKISNELARNLLKISDNGSEAKNIRNFLYMEEVLQAIHKGKILNFLMEKIGGRPYLVEYIPAEMDKKIIGGIITLQDTETVMRVESEIRRSMAKGLVAKYAIDDFIYDNPETAKLIDNLKKYAARDSTILITGPTGTGKEILSHSIHRLSKRSSGPFVSINCASIPEQLLESELFGYEEGSFTGARRGGKTGLFELAHRGTIFLDEIGSMPLSLQGRFLRVLQEREVMRVGGDRLIPIDVRVLAATNEDLRQKISAGHFREDLFFRINVLSLKIPPLSDRPQDIPKLLRRLIGQLSQKHLLPVIRIPKAYLRKLTAMSWPGNVRQLSNFLEGLIILCEGTFSDDIFQKHYAELVSDSRAEIKEKQMSKRSVVKPTADGEYHQTAQTDRIIEILQESKYNRAVTAQRLGIHRTTLWRKMKRAGAVK
jgi:transcriptional regulator, propionate catabolism operon regulatory protein